MHLPDGWLHWRLALHGQSSLQFPAVLVRLADFVALQSSIVTLSTLTQLLSDDVTQLVAGDTFSKLSATFDAYRPLVEAVCAVRRLIFGGSSRRQMWVLAQNISLPPRHDYRPAPVVRLRGYSGWWATVAGGSGRLCFQQCPAPTSRGQWTAPFYLNTIPPSFCVYQWGVE